MDDLKSISVAGHLPTMHETLDPICSPRKSSKVKMWDMTTSSLFRQRGCQTFVRSVEVTETFSGGPWISLLFMSVLAYTYVQWLVLRFAGELVSRCWCCSGRSRSL